jgi:chromate transport protein ChrA
MHDLWSDVKLAMIIISFIFLMKWTTEITESKKLGIILAAIIAYLTFYSHFEILIFVLIFFFAYPFFSEFSEAMAPPKEEKK